MTLTQADARALLDGLAEAVITTSPEGLITGWDGAARRLYGFDATDVIGQPLTWLFPDAAETELEELATLGGAGRAGLVVAIRRRRGTPLRSALALSEGPDGGVVAVALPVAGWLESRGAGAEWERTLGRLVRDLVELAAGDPAALERTESLARLIIEQGRRMIPECEVMLSLVPADRQSHFVIAAASGSWAETQVGKTWPREGTLAGRTMALRRTVETAGIQERSALRATLESGRIESARLVPLWTRHPLPDGRDAIGVLGFYRRGNRYFTPHERRLIEQLARFASLTLQRSELAEAAARATERLQFAVEAASDLSRSLDEREVAERLTVRTRQAIACDRAVVLGIEGNQAAVISARGVTLSDSSGRAFAVAAALDLDGEPFVLRALESLRPIRVTGYRVVGFADADNRRLESLAHTIAVPLPVGGTGVGVALFGRSGEPDFTDDEVALLRTVGNLAALAIRNAALFARVEEAARVKSDFLNMAAHELRTPLTVIRGYLSMLRDESFGALPHQLLEPLAILSAKTDELGRLVDDLLVAARLDTGRLLVSRVPLDLNVVAAAAVERAAARSREVGADVRLEPGRRPAVVSADGELLARLVDGLIANALTFGGANPVVRVTVESSRQTSAVSVSDQGPGVPESERERIFDRFYRYDAGSAPLQAGTGLGLYIARGLAEAMGGRLSLDAAGRGPGASFRVEFASLDPSGD